MTRLAILPEVNPRETSSALALYVHWPFCVSKCPYCDFNSHVRAGIDQDAWREALLADLAYEARLLPGRSLSSIFFGGGTPSLMPPGTVAALIDAAQRHWRADDDLEVTLEANPSSVEAARFADLAAAGVTRLSLGLQSFDDQALRFLGRPHDVAEGQAALDAAQAHFDRVSFDLIYALPFDNEQRWRASLDRAIALGTSHMSLYQLTIEPGTRFATMAKRGDFTPLDGDRAATLFELTQDWTAAAGIPAYEISNHARPGFESRHNLTYWRYGEYAGVGPGAHGRRLGRQSTRHRKPENFLAAVARSGHGIAADDPLTPVEAAREALVMGLRLTEGIDPNAIATRFDLPDLVERRAVARLVDSGHLWTDGQRIATTRLGRPVLDHLLAAIAA